MSERGGPVSRVIVFVLITLFAATNLHAGNVKYKRTVETYTVPGVTLVNQDGKRVDFRSLLLKSEKPVLLDFIYATCTTICPILSVGFSNLQKRLGHDSGSVQLVSISIDPDNDTPEIMKDYLRRYRAKPGWDFLTGNRTDIIAVMRAFDAYVVNKMNHYPLTILHAQGDDKWVRIYGLLGTADLMEEYQKLSGK